MYETLVFWVPVEHVHLGMAWKDGAPDATKALIDMPLDDVRNLVRLLTEKLAEGDRCRAAQAEPG